MKYNTLPGTELTVSEVCLGTMTWGEQNTESQAHEQLDYAVAHGHQLHRHRGDVPGAAQRAHAGTDRDHRRPLARAASRATSSSSRARSRDPGRRDWIRGGRTDLTRDVIEEACGTSLARLRTDYLDIFQIHWPQRNVPTFGAVEFDPAKERAGPSIREQVEGMAALIKAGKIRHYGLSNETTWGVCEFHRVARELGVPGPGHAAEQLQPRVARRRTTTSPRRCSARRCRCSRTARSRWARSPAST